MGPGNEAKSPLSQDVRLCLVQLFFVLVRDKLHHVHYSGYTMFAWSIYAHIVQPGMYFQKLKFCVTFDPNAVYTSFFYHTIALKILYPSIYFLCPRLAQKASFEDTRQFR